MSTGQGTSGIAGTTGAGRGLAQTLAGGSEGTGPADTLQRGWRGRDACCSCPSLCPVTKRTLRPQSPRSPPQQPACCCVGAGRPQPPALWGAPQGEAAEGEVQKSGSESRACAPPGSLQCAPAGGRTVDSILVTSQTPFAAFKFQWEQRRGNRVNLTSSVTDSDHTGWSDHNFLLGRSWWALTPHDQGFLRKSQPVL